MNTDAGYRRLLYTSVPAGTDFESDRLAIIEQSQRANGLDGITGILWSARDLYVQVLEGDSEAVGDTFARISADARHHGVTVLADGIEADRRFGAWAMANIWNTPLTVTLGRLSDLILESGCAGAEALAERIRR